MDSFTEHLGKLQRRRSEYVICGDWNIVHKEEDIKNWKSNQKNSGCLPEERAWLDKVFGDYRWVDAFRTLDQEPEQYTWWSNRGRAWDNNVGWRIDYHVVTPGLKDRVLRTEIYREQRFLRSRAAHHGLRLEPCRLRRPSAAARRHQGIAITCSGR